jgi:hypothetical protein
MEALTVWGIADRVVSPTVFYKYLSTGFIHRAGGSVDNRLPSESQTRGIEYCTTPYLYSPNKYFD